MEKEHGSTIKEVIVDKAQVVARKGITPEERVKRNHKNKIAKQSRKANRGR